MLLLLLLLLMVVVLLVVLLVVVLVLLLLVVGGCVVGVRLLAMVARLLQAPPGTEAATVRELEHQHQVHALKF